MQISMSPTAMKSSKINLCRQHSGRLRNINNLIDQRFVHAGFIECSFIIQSWWNNFVEAGHMCDVEQTRAWLANDQSTKIWQLWFKKYSFKLDVSPQTELYLREKNAYLAKKTRSPARNVGRTNKGLPSKLSSVKELCCHLSRVSWFLRLGCRLL